MNQQPIQLSLQQQAQLLEMIYNETKSFIICGESSVAHARVLERLRMVTQAIAFEAMAREKQAQKSQEDLKKCLEGKDCKNGSKQLELSLVEKNECSNSSGVQN